MSIFDSFKKRATLDAAIKQVAKARKSEGGMAEQLYKGAYQGFASVIADNLMLSEALYQWGFALLHEAGSQSAELAIETLEDAISKFSFCLLTAPNYLGTPLMAVWRSWIWQDSARTNLNSICIKWPKIFLKRLTLFKKAAPPTI